MRFDQLASRAAMAVTVGCVALMAVTIVALVKPSVRTSLGFPPVSAPSYEAGERIGVPPAVYESSRYTLVLFARSDCAACRKAEPLLRSLAAEVGGMSGFQFKVAMDAGSERVRADAIAYAGALGLDPSHVVDVNLVAARVNRVPTLVLVDQRGTVQFDWEPPLPHDEILRALGLVPVDR